ncbi:transporter substrate-binding domain-containing protein, partial [Bittarella massiliensis]
FDGQPAVLAELKSGRVDSMCTDGSLLQGFINDNPDLDGFMIPKDSEINKDVDKEFAIAFPKGSDLIEACNTEIKALQDSGKMDEIVTKWLGEAYIAE